MLVTMSPGRVAWADGMFSQVGMTPITLRLSFSSPIARIVPSTEAAPHMSYFISSMPSPGFNEMPPVSKVMPLPTNTVGASFKAAP